MNKKYIKRIALVLLLSPIILVATVAALLYIPPIQRWAVQKATAYACEQTGLDIHIDALHLSFPLDIELNGLTIKQESDTIADLRSAVVDMDFSRILMLQVSVDAIQLNDGKVNTLQLIPTTHISGTLNTFTLAADAIDLSEESVAVSNASLQGADLNVTLRDTSIIDTTESTPLPWLILLDKVSIADSRIALHMPSQTIDVDAAIQNATVNNGSINLLDGKYEIKDITLCADSLRYDSYANDTLTNGFDPNHIVLSDLRLSAQDLLFEQNPMLLSVHISEGRLHEQCGVELQKLTGDIRLTDANIHVNQLDMQTSASQIQGNIDMDWSAFTPHEGGQMHANVTGSMGHTDVLALAGNYLPEGLAHFYPKQPIQLALQTEGNVDSMSLNKAELHMPTVLYMNAEGTLTQLMDSLQRGADITLDARSMDLNWLVRWQKLNKVKLPPLTLSARLQLEEAQRAKADALLSERNGRAHLVGEIDLKRMVYRAKANIANLQLHDFLPYDSLYQLTAHAQVQGIGTDFLSRHTHLDALVRLDSLRYTTWNIHDVDLSAKLHQGRGIVDLNSDNDLLGLSACLETLVDKKVEAATVSLDLNRIDLHALRLSPNPLSASMVMHVEGNSNLRDTHQIKGQIQAIELATKDSVYHPLDLYCNAEADPTHIEASAQAGDLDMRIHSKQSIDSLLARSDRFMATLNEQLSRYTLAQDTLKAELPDIAFSIHCGQRNPVSNMLRFISGYTMQHLDMDVRSNPTEGLNGTGHVTSFNTGAILLDTIHWAVSHDAEGIRMDATVRNNKRNRVAVFTSNMSGRLTNNGAEATMQFLDANGKKGMDFGARAMVNADAMRVQFTPINPIIAYRRFTLNPDNFIELTREGRLQALVDLLADDGTGLKLYTTPNEDAQQDISLSVNQLNLGDLAQSLPYLPDLTGFLHGDIHFMQQDSTTTISADMEAKQLTYNGTLMGNLGLNAVYFPNNDGTHYLDALMIHEGNEVASLSGHYDGTKDEPTISGTLDIMHLPLCLADAFVPDKMLFMRGYTDGAMQVEGPMANPLLTGELSTDSMHVLLPQYNIDLRFPDNTIRCTDSHLRIDKLTAYAAGDSPMTLDGSVDFSQLDDVLLDLRLNAANYKLIDARRTNNALAYGKVFVNIDAFVRGALDNLRVRGALKVLGNTDVSYVLADSPITVDDQLADLVTFADFSDTIRVEAEEVKRQNIDLQMNISVESAAQMHCILSQDGADRIDLQGGGDLTMAYDTNNDMRLFGRYTILNGVMKYSIMSIPLNNFNIKSGSFVEFNGKMMNPRLNIQASERIKVSVTQDKSPRNVAFNVGLALTQTLEDMGLMFTLEAPEDLTMQNELASMSDDERNRVAITMLITGMYVSNNFTVESGFSYANTLNSYLQSAINRIAGQASSSVDVNFGIENSTTEGGQHTTDYSFSFAKRFWGNRISVVVGGKVSSGKEAVNTEQTIIKNVSVEYRLDDTATRYVRLYYDRNLESLIEGELTEMGGGLVFHRKSNKLGDLFIFKRKEK